MREIIQEIMREVDGWEIRYDRQADEYFCILTIQQSVTVNGREFATAQDPQGGIYSLKRLALHRLRDEIDQQLKESGA